MKSGKIKDLIKEKCEIDSCQENDPSALHLHHIIQRTEINTNNHPYNLAILCSNCHNKVHANKIKLIGIFPSTKKPNNRTLIYEIDGKCNVEGIDSPYIVFKNKEFKIT
jgi:hypothetical protein